jgi:hypothetical protein
LRSDLSSQRSLAVWHQHSPLFGEDVKRAVTPLASTLKKQRPQSTSPARLRWRTPRRRHGSRVLDRDKVLKDEALPGLTLMRVQQKTGSFALCVDDGGMEDLEAPKIYQVLPDREAKREGHLRVIDESGEDYVYPSDLFVPVELPTAVVRRFKSRAQARTPRSIRRAG